MKSICIIGRGNVASHLQTWLSEAGYEVSETNPRTFEGFKPNADLCIVAVTDSAIDEVARKADAMLENSKAIIVHNSGTVPLAELGELSHHAGVLYPMQTFTKGRKLQYNHIPVFVEGDSPETEKALMDLAADMTDNARTADSNLRAHVHLGAVFACNYLNYMLMLAEKSIAPLGLSTYGQLIEETVAKALEIGPEKAQTGPARRGDVKTLWTHMNLLQGHPHTSRVYRLLSQHILNLYKD